jgi:transposase
MQDYCKEAGFMSLFLKNIRVSEVYLKKLQRIEALSMVIVLTELMPF